MPKGDPADLIIGGTVLVGGTLYAGKAAYDYLKREGDLTDEEAAAIETRLSGPLSQADDALDAHNRRRAEQGGSASSD